MCKLNAEIDKNMFYPQTEVFHLSKSLKPVEIWTYPKIVQFEHIEVQVSDETYNVEMQKKILIKCNVKLPIIVKTEISIEKVIACNYKLDTNT